MNSACEATACASGFHTYDHGCEEDTLQNCGAHEVNCTETVTGMKDGTCTDGACVATECSDNYHIYQNACETNEINTCGSHDNNCAVTQTGWKTGVCQNGTCQALTCIENMHIEEGICVADDAEHCGATQINCTQTAIGWNTGDCIEGQCQVATCKSSFHISEGSCVSDSNICCGSECKSCKSNEVCSAGSCSEECAPTLSYCDGECYNTSSDVNHCGDCTTNCDANKPQNAKTMNCLESQYTITTCENGYLLKEGQCVACKEVEGYSTCGGVCLYTANDNNNCGACNNKCDTGLTCSNGKCLGKTTCNDVSVNTATSPEHCGECGHRCENGKICTNGKCVDGQGPMYCNDILTNSLNDSANCSR